MGWRKCCLLAFVVLQIAVEWSVQCDLKCQHGGQPNSICDSCINCLGAWTGKYCENWDSSKDFASLHDQLVGIALSSPSLKANALNYYPHPLGIGIDVTTGTTKLPILQLNASSHSNWTNWRTGKMWLMDDYVKMEDIVDKEIINTIVLQGMWNYVGYLYNYSSQNQVDLLGSFMLQPDLVDFYLQYFSGTSQMTISKWKRSEHRISLSIPIQYYKLDSRAKAALNFLPPDYANPTNKALYRTFVNYWGTNVINSADMGGMMIMQSVFDKKLVTPPGGLPVSDVALQAQYEMYCKTLDPNYYCPRVRDYYTKARTLGSLECRGGNTAEMCSQARLKDWMTSIEDWPTYVRVGIGEFTDLIDEPIRTNIKRAIQEFKNETYNRWTTSYDSCPKCLWGTCGFGQMKCSCYSPYIGGDKCDQCGEGWSGPPDCHTPVCPYCPPQGWCVKPNLCICGSKPCNS